MINIRTITYHIDNKFNNLDIVEKCINDWNNNKYFIRTTRISTPILTKVPSINKYNKLDKFCNKNNIKWFSIPIKLDKNNKLLDFSYDMIKNYNKAFINIEGVKNEVIDFKSIDEYIKLMKKVSLIHKNGEDNFRLGLSVNIDNNTPFFPFSKSSGKLSYSIGLELTQEINNIIDKNTNLDFNKLRNKIIKILDKQICEIEKYTEEISNKYNIEFSGFDFSLAPILEDNGSIGLLIEKLGIKEFNGSGVMFVTAYLTNILKSFTNNHKSIGFNGVMYSLLEDTKLSSINNNIGIKLEDIIKLSCMCGCGIDMIPIYNNTDNEIIKSYILDICAISCRLHKPLGVRFIPVDTSYKITDLNNNDDFITNTKILNLSNNILLNNDIDKFSLLKIK